MTMRQRLAHIALGGVLVLSGMIASSFLQTADSQQSHTEIVKAREFHVVDENGATTAVIASHPAGLKIQNASGKTAIAAITADPNGGGNLVINNVEGTPAVGIGIDPYGDPDSGIVSIFNISGVRVASMIGHRYGSALQIHNASGKSGVLIGLEPTTNCGFVSIFDANATGKRAAMGVDKDGSGFVRTWDKKGNPQK